MHRRQFWNKLLVSGVCIVFLTACQVIPVEEEIPVAPVIRSYETKDYEQTIVLRGDLQIVRGVTCRYSPAMKENLSFGVGGEYIESIHVAEGQLVKAGDLLAELSLGTLYDQVSAREYQVEVLKRKLEHVKENMALALKRQEVAYALSDPETRTEKRKETEENYRLQLQETEDSLYIEEIRLDELRKQLSERLIYAGIDGTVTYVHDVESGQKSVEDQLFITVADMDTAVFRVEGKDAEYFPVGTEVMIRVGKKELAAVSVEASMVGGKESEDLAMAYFLLKQPDLTLEDGDSGRIEVILDQRKDVLYVEKEAIKNVDGRKVVYILNEDGWKVLQDVETGLETKTYVEIKSGLKEGDSVILE